MKYCGVVPTQSALQLAMLEEVRTPEPPVRLSVMFFEPGSAATCAADPGSKKIALSRTGGSDARTSSSIAIWSARCVGTMPQ